MSSTVTCPNCLREIPSFHDSCPHCGQNLPTGSSEHEEEYHDDGERGSSRWIRPVSVIVLAALVAPYLLSIRAGIAAWIVFGAAIAGIIFYLFRPSGRTGGGSLELPGSERRAYEDLVRKARGDRALADRLIEHERRRNPSLPRARLIRDAIERWEYDRRR